MRSKASVTVGRLEPISFPDLKVGPLLAKVDTGAYSGALHCTNMKVARRRSDKQRVLRFTPLGDKQFAQETTDFEETFVRSASGHRKKRFIITTRVVLQDKTYSIRIGLSGRDKMRREVLLGRKFLRDNGMLVDVRINSELDDKKEDIQ